MLNETAIEQPKPKQTASNNQYDISAIMGGLYGPGIIGMKSAFSRDWIQQLHEDIIELYKDALTRPGGAVGRGPKRHYVEIHPEDIYGFIDLATHPWGFKRYVKQYWVRNIK